MKTMMMTVLACTLAVHAATAAQSDRCEKAERDRQKAEIDHAVGKASEKQLREAREAVERHCK